MDKSMTRTLPTFVIELYLSGPVDIAKQVLRREFLKEGLCVTVTETTFIYRGGEERGYVIGLRNYPRYPMSETALVQRARQLLHTLVMETHQLSGLMVTPIETEWFTPYPELKGPPQ